MDSEIKNDFQYMVIHVIVKMTGSQWLIAFSISQILPLKDRPL